VRPGDPPCAGLANAITLIKDIKEEFPEVSWADLMQMGSAVAIKVRSGRGGVEGKGRGFTDPKPRRRRAALTFPCATAAAT